jgi:hypothetical protein
MVMWPVILIPEKQFLEKYGTEELLVELRTISLSLRRFVTLPESV